MQLHACAMAQIRIASVLGASAATGGPDPFQKVTVLLPYSIGPPSTSSGLAPRH